MGRGMKAGKKPKKTYSQLEVDLMCEIHKKELNKVKMETITLVETMYKNVLYTYLVDVKKFKQADLEKLDIQFAKAMLSMGNKNLTLEELGESLKKNGINMEEVNAKTDNFIATFGGAWK